MSLPVKKFDRAISSLADIANRERRGAEKPERHEAAGKLMCSLGARLAEPFTKESQTKKELSGNFARSRNYGDVIHEAANEVRDEFIKILESVNSEINPEATSISPTTMLGMLVDGFIFGPKVCARVLTSLIGNLYMKSGSPSLADYQSHYDIAFKFVDKLARLPHNTDDLLTRDSGITIKDNEMCFANKDVQRVFELLLGFGKCPATGIPIAIDKDLDGNLTTVSMVEAIFWLIFRRVEKALFA